MALTERQRAQLQRALHKIEQTLEGQYPHGLALDVAIHDLQEVRAAMAQAPRTDITYVHRTDGQVWAYEDGRPVRPLTDGELRSLGWFPVRLEVGDGQGQEGL